MCHKLQMYGMLKGEVPQLANRGVEGMHFKSDNYPQWTFWHLPVKHLVVFIMGDN